MSFGTGGSSGTACGGAAPQAGSLRRPACLPTAGDSCSHRRQGSWSSCEPVELFGTFIRFTGSRNDHTLSGCGPFLALRARVPDSRSPLQPDRPLEHFDHQIRRAGQRRDAIAGFRLARARLRHHLRVGQHVRGRTRRHRTLVRRTAGRHSGRGRVGTKTRAGDPDPAVCARSGAARARSGHSIPASSLSWPMSYTTMLSCRSMPSQSSPCTRIRPQPRLTSVR